MQNLKKSKKNLKKFKKKFKIKKISHFFFARAPMPERGYIFEKIVVCHVTGFVFKIIIVTKNNCKKNLKKKIFLTTDHRSLRLGAL